MNLEDLVITNERLGEGEFGSMFVGQLGEKKVAAKKLSESKSGFNNFIREASKLKRLRHGKHIAYTYGITLRDENLYTIMEYCEHGNLQNYLKANRESVTYEQKILFCHGIVLGLLYCYSMKIFHGDIKCSNVLLGKNLEPKLTDFGLGITVDNIANYNKLYNGSLYWAAPELFSIKEDETVYQELIADPYPCDVYSLGATFCEISYEGTTDFIDSDDLRTDVMLGLVSPTPKDAFLEEIITRCCQFKRNERISLDKCLSMLDVVAEKQLLVPAIDEKWLRIQQGIKANSKLMLPSSFILCRPAENLVVGPSNLSLLEWLCISDNLEAVKYMIQLHNPEQKQLEWLYSISALCESPNTAEFLQSTLQSSTTASLTLLDLVDINAWQLIEAFVKAGANCDEDELLCKAVEGSHNKVVQLLVDNAPFYEKIVVHDAVEFGNVEAIRILANSFDLEFRNENGDTPLLVAINVGNAEIVKTLLDCKVDFRNKNNRSQHISRIGGQHTPLIRAAVKGNHEIVELLVNAGATIDTESSEWDSLVQDLEQRGKGSIIQLISDARKKRKKATEKDHSTATPINNGGGNERSAEDTFLYVAIRNGQSDLVQKLIDDGADINERGHDKYSPLHWAVIIENKEIARTLLKAGANIDVKTPNQEKNYYTPSNSNYFNGYTPLHIAIVKRRLRIVKLLIESGANFSLKNEAGQKIMEIADDDDKKRIESIIQECAPVTEDSFQWILETMSMETVKTLINSRDASMDTLNHFLCIAAHHGNTEAIHYLLEHGTKVNGKYKGKSPLEWAISGGHVQIVQILIDQGVEIPGKENRKHNSESVTMASENWSSSKNNEVNEAKSLSDPPLHQAAALDNVEIVEILLKAGVDIDARNDAGYNALYYAALCGCDEVVTLLHEKGAKVKLWEKTEDSDAIYKTAKYILHKAVETGKVNTERLFTDAGIRVNSENMGNCTPPLIVMLIKNEIIADSSIKNSILSSENLDKTTVPTEAVSNNQSERAQLSLDGGADINAENIYAMKLLECVDKSLVDMVQSLIEKGADVNARTKDGYVPIHNVKDREVAEILIAHGADINAKSVNGATPLFGCVKNSLVDMVQFLLEKGADVNVRSEMGFSPIHYAKDIKIAEILIAHGADINAKNADEVTLLFQCVWESWVDMIQFLLEKGADVNARGKDGSSPIHFARDVEIAEILIAHGADINARSTNGKTPLFQCVYELRVDMVQFLLKKGADVNARTNDGWTPIHYALDKEIAEILIAHGADVNAKNNDGKTLFDILLDEQNKNLDNTAYNSTEVSELLEYLKNLK